MNKPVMAILLAVAAANIGYAVWRTIAGRPLDDSLPLLIGGLVCATIAMAISRKKAKADQESDGGDVSHNQTRDDGYDGFDGGDGGGGD